jgi:hypothetical protein
VETGDRRRQSVRNLWTAVLVASGLLGTAAYVARGLVHERLGRDNPVEGRLDLLIAALVAVTVVAAVARYRVGLRILPWSPATGPHAEFRGGTRFRLGIFSGSPTPFSRLVFDDRHLMVRGPGIAYTVDREGAWYVQVERNQGGACVDVRRANGTWLPVQFCVRHPEPVMSSLVAHGWPLVPLNFPTPGVTE